MTRIPHVNASLMHEVRMIAMVALPALIPVVKKLSSGRTPASLICCTCLATRAIEPRTAITMFNGTALCREHLR